MTPRLSVVVPVYNEGVAIVERLERLVAVLRDDVEILVVYDSPDDTTAPFVAQVAGIHGQVRPLLNTYGAGVAHAIRFGFERADAAVVVVTMGDGSDDPELIGPLVELVSRGAAIAAASRYAPGGRQVGGPLVKGVLSRAAGLTLRRLAGVPIHDPTNAFKAYSADFVRSVGIHSSQGFEMALELVAKAHRLRLPMAELPTTWRDRTEGSSNFRLLRWLPAYFRWYRFAFGAQLSLDAVREKGEARG